MAKIKRTEHGSFAKWRQRIKKERALVRLIVVCALLLFACVFIAAFHVNRILNTFEQTSYDYVFNRSELSSQYFSENFKRRGSLVSAEALVLAEDDDIDKATICNGLKVLEETGEFSYARYISNRGIRYRPDGSLISTKINQYADRIDPDKEISVYRNFDPERSNDEISFGAVVEKNGVIQGYLIGIANASEMFESGSTSSSSMVAERYLTDSLGDIVAYTKNEKIYDGTGKNIFDLLTKDCIDDYAAQQVREEVLN